MQIIVKKTLLTLLFGILILGGIYQVYYIVNPQNIAYALKKEGYKLSAYDSNIVNNEIKHVKELLYSGSQKPEELIWCEENTGKRKTNYIDWCRSMYEYSSADTNRYEIAKSWCGIKL